MEMPPVHCGPNEWIDATGYKWCSRFGTLDIIDGCRESGLDMGMLEDESKINFGTMGGLVWYGVRYMARAQRISRERFYADRCTPKVLGAALEATVEAFQNSMAPAEEPGDIDPQTPAPAGPSGSPTSSSSPDAPA